MSWNALTSQPDALGESPFWHPTEQMLYWVDIQGKQIRRANVFMGTVQSWALPQEPGCIAPAASGGLVIALRDGIYRAHEWGGALTQIQHAEHDPATSRFNDGKADPLGRFWAGTIFEPRTSAAAALYAIDCRPAVAAEGSPLQRMAGDATVANGLGWSPDARTLYWTDTTRHLIQAWDWDANGNVMSGQRVFKQFPLKPAGWTYDSAGHLGTYGGRPDGAAVDVQGNYWVAMFEGARVLKLSPAGDILADIALPAQCPTMPCFGGDDLQTLYVTTARHGRSAKELADKPQSGCVFFMRVDVPGLPVNLFRD
jgi:sugar lactone lactonase YvrE